MFEPAKQVKKFAKVCLWGDFKQGKTAFALSFPAPAVIDTEKGTLLYADRFAFSVHEVIRWKDLGKALDWVAANPGKFQTLIIDSVTPLYKDLVDEVTEVVRRKRGSEANLSFGDWGIIKRRFNGFLTRLLELPVHVVMTVRAKDEYEHVKDHRGEDVSRKTGDISQDVDKAINYLFDFVLRCRAEIDKSTKKPTRYTVLVEGSRRPELKRGEVIDVTGKRGYETVFRDLEKILCSGEAMAVADGADPALDPEDAAAVTEKRLEEVDRFFGARHPGEPCTVEDLKVLFTRAGQVRWPGGEKFTVDQAKQLIKLLYGVESAKELYKHEVGFVYDELGKVLAGRSTLARDVDSGSVIIASLESVD